MTITEVHDPRTALVAPSGPAQDFADSLRWKAGPLLGGLDWLVEQLTGTSAIAALVEPLSGDWVGLEKGAQAWGHSAQASLSVAANYAALTTSVAPQWDGIAADAFIERVGSIAEGYAQYADGCTAMREVTEALLDLCKATAEAIAGILGFIGDYLTRLMIEASIPVVGWVAGAIDGAVSGAMLLRKLERGYRLLQKVLEFVERFREVLLALQKVAYAIMILARATTAVVDTQAVAAGDRATSTAFGVR
ncbi:MULTISPECIES: hypothetical protein [unclassified Actinotalea]|uniref:hypothetical protein n=1 Tax=unclassified Actinotalea TaxID=2638618 RepID=UPI0015F5F8EF|nr:MULTISPECIES: hypothetical protein [unclassified Actinotalea]